MEGRRRPFAALTKDILEPHLDALKRLKPVHKDELNHRYVTFTNLTLEEAVYAAAGLYAFFKEMFADALADPAVMGPWATDCRLLPLHVQHFWASYFFNTSSGHVRGIKAMIDQSIEFHDSRWMQEDDYDLHSGNGKDNATWRTATFRFLANQAAP